jgi:PAS domain S-box-containing protein
MQQNIKKFEPQACKADPAGPEKPFAQEEQYTRKILNSLIEHVVYHDMDMKVLWANRAACRSVGLRLDQVTGRHCYEIWAQRSDPCGDCPLKRSAETGQPYSVEKRTPDGRHWHIIASPVLDATGQIVSMVELTLDITDRKEMEDALKKSQGRLQTLVATIPHGIQEVDPHGTITFANPAYHRIYGYQDQEMIGKSVLDLQTSSSAKAELSAYLAKLVEAQPQPTPYRAKNYTREGEVIDVQVDWNYKRDNHGRVTGFIAVVTDVTEPNRATEALRQAKDELEQRVQERTAQLAASEAKFRGLVENTKDIPFSIDAGGILQYVGPQVESYGFDPNGLQGCNISDLVFFDDREQVVEAFNKRLLEGDETPPLEFRIQASDNSIHWFEARCTLQPGASGKKIGFTGVLRDVTARIQVEKQRDQHQAQLQRLASKLAKAQDEEQRRIAEGLHDDVAQDLALCSLKLALVDEEEDPNRCRALREEVDALICRATEKIRSLSFELFSSTLFRVGLEAAILELCDSMSARYDLRFNVECDTHVWNIADPVAVVLFKAVRELLFNVVKHSGAKEASVFVGANDSELKLVVEDRGVGFTDPTDGLVGDVRRGLGLFGISERLKDLGGELRIESNPGIRTRVTLHVPVGKKSNTGKL